MKKIYLPILLFLSLLHMPFSSTLAHGGQVTYCAHIAYDGWLGWVYDGQTAGSPGSGKEMQAVKIQVTGFPPSYHIYYQAHVAHDGWLSWVSDGEVAGTIGEAKQMEALKIELRGFPSNYHVTYRAYVQSSGWQSWVSDGAVAGTTGQAKAMEALQIKIYADPPHIISISPTQVEASTFDLTINGSNFDDGAVDQIYWKADDHFVGQGTALSRSSTQLVVREYMEGTDPGTYVVKVKNSDGQLSNGVDLEITHENQPPEAKITMTSGGQTAYENQTLNLTVSPGGTAHVDFSASRSFDPDGSISSYRWYINGAPVSTSMDFGFDLGEGTHDIYLTVTDNEGAEGSVGASIVITEEAENQPPEAKITMTSGGQTAYENQTLNLTVSPGGTARVDFSASRSFDPDGSISSYRWYINGAPVSTSMDFGFDLGEGTHDIYLTVTDNEGAEGSVGASIVVEEDTAPHITSISPTQVEASTFDLTINGSNFDDGAVDQIYWKADGHFVGQGTVLSRSSTQLFVREYMEGTEPGTYVVKVKNSDGQLSNGVDLEIISEPSIATYFSYPVGYPIKNVDVQYYNVPRIVDPPESRMGCDFIDPYYGDNDNDHIDETLHPAEDWNGGSGTQDYGDPVYAVADGNIVAAQDYFGDWGKIILIKHILSNGEAVYSQYAHLKEILKTSGKVRRGEKIGTIGWKGTGPHLHFEIRRSNMEGVSASYWPSGNGKDADWINSHYYNPSDVGGYTYPGPPPAEGFIEDHLSPYDRIVDNLDPEFSKGGGNWELNKDSYRNYYYISDANPGSCWAEWKPNLPVTGQYEVFVCFWAYPDQSISVPYTVYYDGGQATINIDQLQTFDNSDFRWHQISLGTFNFQRGNSGYVRLSGAPNNTNVDTIWFKCVGTTDERIEYLDNGVIKVGVNLDWGGAITEISHNGFNLVDTHDLGRLIQVSFWDGDDPTWNPIQAGGITGQTNPVLEYDTESNLIYTKTQLIDWYTGELRDVYLEQLVTLLDQISGHDVNTVIEVRYKIIYTGDAYHAFWDQEFPCAYLNSALSRLVWYQNDYPWTNDSVNIYDVPTDQPNFEFYPTEYWAAFVNDQDFGLTLYSHDHTSKWAANRFTIDTQPSYLVTIDQFGIEPGTVEEATEYFVVGNYTDTREIIYLLNSCPTAQFTGDKTEGPKPLTVQFTDQSTGVIDSWYWAFGDGGTSTEQNPIHTYNTPDTYTVSLTVTGPGGTDTETKPDYITVTAEWTFFVYLGADNSLSSFADADLDEMQQVGSDSNVNVVTLVDQIGDHDTHFYKVEHGSLTETPLSEINSTWIDEVDMSDPNTLITSVNYVINQYPAKRYCIVLWNHGDGWRKTPEKVIYRQIIEDKGNMMRMDEVGYALGEIKAHLGSEIDLVGFDACLMGMVEVAYEIRNHAEAMVGSEDLVGGEGWPYDAILEDLVNDAIMDSETFAAKIVDRYAEQYDGTSYWTLSALRLNMAHDLAMLIDDFANSMTSNWDEIRLARSNSQEFAFWYITDFHEHIDLYDFCSELNTAKAQAVMGKLDDMVINERHGSGLPDSHGLAIYFPANGDDYDSEYHASPDHQIMFPIDTSWDEFLARYYASQIWEPAYDTLFRHPSDLTLLRQYRDKSLNKTKKGKLYTKLLYNRSEKALQVLLQNPELMIEAKHLIEANKDAVSEVLNGYEGVIYNTDEIVSFLKAYARKSPPDLKLLAITVEKEMLRQQRQGGKFLGFRLK